MSFRRLIRRISQRGSRKPRRGERISMPTNFEHRVHVVLDRESGRYIGLPPQWASIINTKVPHATRRTNSTPDLRHHNTAKQNSGVQNTNNHFRNSFQNDQELTIERLKLELREHKGKSPELSSVNRFSCQEDTSSLPRQNGNINNNELEKTIENASPLSPVSLTAVRSESSV